MKLTILFSLLLLGLLCHQNADAFFLKHFRSRKTTVLSHPKPKVALPILYKSKVSDKSRKGHFFTLPSAQWAKSISTVNVKSRGSRKISDKSRKGHFFTLPSAQWAKSISTVNVKSRGSRKSTYSSKSRHVKTFSLGRIKTTGSIKPIKHVAKKHRFSSKLLSSSHLKTFLSGKIKTFGSMKGKGGFSFKGPFLGKTKTFSLGRTKTTGPIKHLVKGRLHQFFSGSFGKARKFHFGFKVHSTSTKLNAIWTRFKRIAKTKFHLIPVKFQMFWGRFIGRGSYYGESHSMDYDTCMCTGDPHCISLDGKRFDYQGTCQYRMFKTPPGTTPSVEITTKLGHIGSNTRVSYNRIVTVKVGNYSIIINGENRYVKACEGDTALDDCDGVVDDYYIDEHNVTIEKEGINPWRSRIQVNIRKAGIIVKFNQWSNLIIDISTKYKNNADLNRPDIQGFCGNYNGNKNDDGKDIEVMSENAKVGGDGDCMKSMNIDRLKISAKAEATCKKIFMEDLPTILKNVVSGYRCKVDMEDIPKQIKNCAIDMTLLAKSDRCTVLANQLSDCIVSWREEFGCPMKCPAHSKYVFNKPTFVSTCVLPIPLNATLVDGEGCLCEDGYVQSNDECVKPSECGCFTQGNYRGNGETWIQRVKTIISGKEKFTFFKYQCTGMKPKRIMIQCKYSDKCFLKQPGKEFVCCPAEGCANKQNSVCGDMIEIGNWQEKNNDGFYDPLDLSEMAREVEEATTEEVTQGLEPSDTTEEMTTEVQLTTDLPEEASFVTDAPEEMTTEVQTTTDLPEEASFVTDAPEEVTTEVQTTTDLPEETSFVTDAPEEVTTEVQTTTGLPDEASFVTDAPEEDNEDEETETEEVTEGKTDTGPPSGDNSRAVVDRMGEKMDERYFRETINKTFTMPVIPHEVVRGIATATASSYTKYAEPFQAMNMHNIRGWMPDLRQKAGQQCLTYDLGSELSVHGIASAGGYWNGKCSYVKRYTVYLSTTGDSWQIMYKKRLVKGKRRERAFLNKHCDSITFHCLHRYYGNPFPARYVRVCIVPRQWQYYPMLKFTVYGFRKRNDQAHILGMMYDRNTVSITGCQCYWDLSLKTCACCLANARQCSSSYPYQCVRAGDAAMCGSVDALPKWAKEKRMPNEILPGTLKYRLNDGQCAADQAVCPTDPTKCQEAGSLRCIEVETPNLEIQLKEADTISSLIDISQEEGEEIVREGLEEMEEEVGKPEPTQAPPGDGSNDEGSGSGPVKSAECICPEP